MGVMLIIARIDWLMCKRKGCDWCISASARGFVSRPAWSKTADRRTWSVSGAEVKRELKKRTSGWAVVTNAEACGALPEMKDLCIAIQYTPGVCCFLWVPVVIYTPLLMMSVVFNTLSLDWSWCQQFFGSHTCDPCSVSRHTEHQRLPTSLCVQTFSFLFCVKHVVELIDHCSPDISLFVMLLCWKTSHISPRGNWQDQPGFGRKIFSGAIEKLTFCFPPGCCRCALLKSHECLHLKWRWSRPADLLPCFSLLSCRGKNPPSTHPPTLLFSP